MGNTSSQTSQRLRRDKSLISKPRALAGSVIDAPTPSTADMSPHILISDHSQSASSQSITVAPSLPRGSSVSSPSSLESSSETTRRGTSDDLPRPRGGIRVSAPPPYDEVSDPSSSTHVAHEMLKPHIVEAASGHRRTLSESLHFMSSRDRLATQPSISARSSSRSLAASARRVDSGSTSPGSKHAKVVILPPMPPPKEADLNDRHGASRVSDRKEDPLEELRRYKTVFVVDDSNSMKDELWSVTREVLASLTEAAAVHDDDGIDVHFLNDTKTGLNLRSGSSVKRLFDSIRPGGITPTGAKLEELLRDYLQTIEREKNEMRISTRFYGRQTKPVNFIVITDGVPTDDPEPVIVQAARWLDAGNFPITQVGIQFVQVGNDPRAGEALQELDDSLSKTYGIRDIVDTTPLPDGGLTLESLVKVLLGGINRRVDKRGGSSVLS